MKKYAEIFFLLTLTNSLNLHAITHPNNASIYTLATNISDREHVIFELAHHPEYISAGGVNVNMDDILHNDHIIVTIGNKNFVLYLDHRAKNAFIGHTYATYNNDYNFADISILSK
ncbi:MAG: hypothetical protein NC038_04550 [Paludibacter sp.]|nr:hypothetical protein [Bacteroidales bacterium]MCM1069372.1 hypothetical protein [Prevotella sp.]MCM1353892.1 hypothetical protein [Bacteroides sp.]MCM1442858.1 hypothetical protein [Muribaculum sp.]MCM1481903.1 hypothetical protein [Paludibacter sp.]